MRALFDFLTEFSIFDAPDPVNRFEVRGNFSVIRRKKGGSTIRGVQLRKHSKAREKRYSFGYAVSFIFACYQILWTFPKSLYLCSRYLLLAYG